MSPFQEVLRIAREQSAALARGDLDSAVLLLQERAVLLANAGIASTPEDQNAIREVLRRDRDLSSAIRERMLEIRASSLALQQGRTAINGYGSGASRQLGLLDARR